MLADYWPQLLLAWSVQWLGLVSPGPSVMLLVSVATSQGRGPSILTAFGMACGSMMLAGATVLGISTLLAQTANAMTVLRIFGALYLAWLGYKALKTAWHNPPLPAPGSVPARPVRAAFVGFGLHMTNPKAVGFWIAIASLGAIGEAPLAIIALFVAGAFANSFIGHGAYALALSSPPLRALYGRFRRWIEGTLGTLFVAASLRLALTR